MIEVTIAAKNELSELLDRLVCCESTKRESLRLVAEPYDYDDGELAQLELLLDVPRRGDAVVEHRGREVLVVDLAASDLLDGMTLDVVDTPDGRKLSLRG